MIKYILIGLDSCGAGILTAADVTRGTEFSVGVVVVLELDTAASDVLNCNIDRAS